jgi:uncharacterized membrane protein YfcA
MNPGISPGIEFLKDRFQVYLYFYDQEVSMLTALLAFLIVLVGSIVQGSIGIGLGFIAVPLLVLLDQAFIPGPLLLVALILTILVSFREYHNIEFSKISWAILGRIAGTFIGTGLLILIPDNKLAILFGIVILLAVGLSIIGYRLILLPRNLVLTGILSGIMGTTSAMGGIPMALIYQDLQGPKLRGTLSAIFVIGTLISLVSLLLIGRFGIRELVLAVEIMPGVLIGYVVSNHTIKIFDKGLIRSVVLILAASSGLIILMKNFI